MKSRFIIQYLLLLLLQLLYLIAGQINQFPVFRCRDDGNFTRNSAYETNLKAALDSLSSAATTGYGFYNTSTFCLENLDEGRAMELMDPTIAEKCSKDEVMRCINIALLCVQEDVDARPSMAYVLNILNNYSITLPTPTTTPHYLPKRRSYSSNSKSISKSTDESPITQVHAR